MAAVVAAPIRKLCPAYCCCGRPIESSIWRSCVMNQDFDTTLCDESTKNAPELLPLEEMKLTIAFTGHTLEPVAPITMSDPWPNWSHFDLLRWIWNIVGAEWLSTETSPQVIPVAGSKDVAVSGKSSPRRKKPKNAVHAMAQRAAFSGCEEDSR